MSLAQYDAAIVGGGPAGTCAAITLAQAGLRVGLFEAKTYPHHKVCGEFLSPECMNVLGDLGIADALIALRPPPLDRVSIDAPSGAVWSLRLPVPAWGVSRYALDAALADRARALGVTVCEGATVRDVQGDLDAGFRLDVRMASGATAAAARVVIAAHGKRSGLDRALDRAFLTQPQPFVALKAHFHGPPLPEQLHLHTFPGGYCGMSEVEGGAANMCLLVREPVFRRGCGSSGDIEAFVRWMGVQNRRLGEWLAEAVRISPQWLSIAQVPFVDKRAVVHDVLMAGDAAGLITPLAGDGIAMALDGGLLAARHVTAYLAGDLSAADLRTDYARAWRGQFGARLKLGRMLQAIMLRPAVLSPVLRLMNTFPALGEALFARTRDPRALTHAAS